MATSNIQPRPVPQINNFGLVSACAKAAEEVASLCTSGPSAVEIAAIFYKHSRLEREL
jgi:hypothetical protein